MPQVGGQGGRDGGGRNSRRRTSLELCAFKKKSHRFKCTNRESKLKATANWIGTSALTGFQGNNSMIQEGIKRKVGDDARPNMSTLFSAWRMRGKVIWPDNCSNVKRPPRIIRCWGTTSIFHQPGGRVSKALIAARVASLENPTKRQLL